MTVERPDNRGNAKIEIRDFSPGQKMVITGTPGGSIEPNYNKNATQDTFNVTEGRAPPLPLKGAVIGLHHSGPGKKTRAVDSLNKFDHEYL